MTVVLRAKKPVCSGCGARGLKIKEHRAKRWQHLDLGACRCVIECRLRRLYCPGCGEVYEAVSWARAGAPYSRDFDDLVAWLAQQMSQTQVTRLMRIAWESVGMVLERVVSDELDHGRLDGLVQIGVDEVSYGADHKFLTCVADHSKGRIVWAAPGRNAKTLQAFFDSLTDEQKASITAVSIDMSAGYEKAIRSPAGVPHAQVVFDPFHVVALGSKATDQVRRAEYNQHGRSHTDAGKVDQGDPLQPAQGPLKADHHPAAQALRGATDQQAHVPRRAAHGELRYVYKVPKHQAHERLDAWLAWASRSRLKPFVKLARTIRKHKAGVLAAVELGISKL